MFAQRFKYLMLYRPEIEIIFFLIRVFHLFVYFLFVYWIKLNFNVKIRVFISRRIDSLYLNITDGSIFLLVNKNIRMDHFWCCERTSMRVVDESDPAGRINK